MVMTYRDTKGSGLTNAEGDANFRDLDQRMGWADYNDLATTATPIPLTLADTDYPLTNDGLGANTNKAFIPSGHGEIWDAATNQFDFSSLNVGDVVTLRIDLMLHASGPSREFDLYAVLGIGHASEFTINIDHQSFKSAGDYELTIVDTFYVGSAFVKDYPAELRLRSDGTGDTVTVNGWFAKTEVR